MKNTEQVIDKLNRTEFVHFIENLIINSNKYKRNNNSKSYVMALDSAWGTGKTYFLKLLKQDLEESEDIYLINYNAWENDYCDNAFNPLLYDILDSECLKFSTVEIADKENTKNILRNVFRVGAAFGKQMLGHKLGIDIEEAFEKANLTTEDIKSLMLSQIPDLKTLNNQREAFIKFKEYLSVATDWIRAKNGKLVIVIDELDRCKPTFAIQTLEMVKHIFDVDNIVFLIAVDIQQLSHSISSVYGQGFDSTGYLCRFFDYIAKLPVPDIKPYIQERIKEIHQLPEENHTYFKTNKYISFVDIIADYFCDMYTMFDFSLRDLDTVIQSYKILVDVLLKDYEMYGAHMIYIFYLSLKYKKRNMFDKTFIDTANYRNYIRTELETFIDSCPQENPWLTASVKEMYTDKALSAMELLPGCSDKGESMYNKRMKVINVSEKQLLCVYRHYDGGRNVAIQKEIPNYIGASFGNILFYADLHRWDEIKNRTYREHLHKQLEMFNFMEETEV